jgi:hypothetical protein
VQRLRLLTISKTAAAAAATASNMVSELHMTPLTCFTSSAPCTAAQMQFLQNRTDGQLAEILESIQSAN